MYAIFRDRGRQYKAGAGDVLDLDLRAGCKAGDALSFDEVLLTSNGTGEVRVGKPLVAGAKVQATVVDPDKKGDKIDVVHFRRRKDSSDKKGFRPRTTRVRVEKIEG